MLLIRAQLTVLCLVLLSTAPLVAAAAPPLSLAKAWFTPSLVVNQDPICDAILEGTSEKFASTFSWDSHEGNAYPGLTKVPGAFEGDSAGDADFRQDSTDPRLFVLGDRPGEKVYVLFESIPGCGSACDRESVEISAQAPRDGIPDASEARTPDTAAGWEIYRSAHGQYYLIGTVERRREVYKVASPKDWRLSCAVTLAPEHLPQIGNVSMNSAMESIHALDTVIAAMAGGAGACGTLDTGSRWRDEAQAALDETLYRPWAVVTIGASSANSYGSYSRIWPSLLNWSLGGPGEYRTIGLYQHQLAKTTQILARFYQDSFGWPHHVAMHTAYDALTNAVSYNFGFYLYDYYRDGYLRQLILEHAPMATIRAIVWNTEGENRDGSNNLLSVAVGYPEALKYLLARGLNPNIGNEFGKTPLMYAAQFNQIQSVRILLDAGADPNTGTFIPADTCNYTLHTTNMTALHYAVRYASAQLVTLLLDRGALTFVSADNPGPNEYPIRWLESYGGSVGADRNKNLSDSDVAMLRKRLAVPAAPARQSIARADVLIAERDYAAARFSEAFRGFRDALRADETNAKAIADLPLAALKAGKDGVALAAADQAIEHSTTSQQKAAAWFNKALACQANASERTVNRRGMCGQDYLQMLVTSYDIDPSPSRARAIRQLFDAGPADVCVLPTEGVRIKEYEWYLYPWTLSKFTSATAVAPQGDRAYILGPAEKSVPLDALSWVRAPEPARMLGEHVPVMPYRIATYDLGEDQLQIVEGNFAGEGVRGQILVVNGQRCAYNGPP